MMASFPDNLRLKFTSPVFPIFVGLIVRLLHLKFILPGPVLKILIIDSAYYHNWAKQIAGGNILGEGAFFLSPLYPYLMGLFYRIFGTTPVGMVLFQIALSAVTLYLIWFLGKSLAGKTAALIAVWMGAVYPVWVYYDGALLTASLILFLNASTLYFLHKWLVTKQPGLLALGGIFLGLSVLARPSILLFAFALATWLFLKKQHLAAGLLLLWTLVPIAPVTARNIAVTGEFALTTASAGMNFFLGNNPQATGLYMEAEFLKSADPENEFRGYVAEAQHLSWRELTPAQASRFWFQTGAVYLLTHPLKWLELCWKKLFYFCNNLEAPNNVSFYLVKRYSPFVRCFPFSFGILVSMGLVGLFLLPKSEGRLLLWLYLLCILVANLLFFTSSEFRFPMMIAIFIGAGVFLHRLFASARDKRWNWMAITAMLALLLFTHYQTPLARELKSPRMDFYNYGSVSLKAEDYMRAKEFFLLSLSEDPNFAQAHIGLGMALTELGEYKKAAEEFQSAGFPLTEEFLKSRRENRSPTSP